ncbi:Hypothetical protein, putative [Bodo saltans]|uniref:Membrane-associated protein n=1 Tax=Bodo saltans TaxID=75058 RepID=A0A0S4IXQ8_BODSA|nr:Hypothetical protein, putative [Bodo saltans]|eukprot:CUG04903.1 Hypothetical protein, putative [Bodo saltans]
MGFAFCLAALIAVSAAHISPPLMVSTVTSAIFPVGIDVDEYGNVLLSSQGTCTISKMPRGGTLSVIAGTAGSCTFRDGVGPAARFYYPCGIARLGSILYIADEYNNRIRVLDLTTFSVSTLTGSALGYLKDA